MSAVTVPPLLDVEATPGVIVRHARAAARHRAVVVAIGLAVATFVVFCISVSVGDFPIPLRDVVPAILGFGNSDSDFIIRTLRLPRALTGMLVGAAFGMSGSIFQSLARNPLASPDIIGITAGASAAAVFIIVIVDGTYAQVALGALLGALLTSLAIYLLAWKRGLSPYRLVLVGIGIAAMLQSVTAFLLTRAEIFDAQRATIWLTGSLNARGWEHVRSITIALVVLAPAAIFLSRPLRTLQLGDDTARSLGVRVERTRTELWIVAVMLAALATASAGPIEFVAFVAPAIARRLTRSSFSLIPAALMGGLLVVTADVIARRLFAPTELPVGVVTGVLGAPYLLWLLARANRVGRAG